MIRVLSILHEEVHLSVYQVLKPVSSKATCTYLCHFTPSRTFPGVGGDRVDCRRRVFIVCAA
jgi:hypothetical protein